MLHYLSYTKSKKQMTSKPEFLCYCTMLLLLVPAKQNPTVISIIKLKVHGKAKAITMNTTFFSIKIFTNE